MAAIRERKRKVVGHQCRSIVRFALYCKKTVDSTERQQEVLCASDLLKMVNAPDMDINAGLPVYCALHIGAKIQYSTKRQ